MRRSPEFWRRDGALSRLLSPLSLLWTACGRARFALARPYRAPVPVVCVGNIVAGGAGKTPVVLDLARRLDAHVVTRGYGGRLQGPVRVADHDYREVGDEPLLLACIAPTWVARDRAAGIRAAVAAGARTVVLDDGFQNPSFAKDLSLLVVDGLGNGRVIPAGPLREPLADALARAQALVLMGGEIAASGPVLRARLEPVDADDFAGRKVVAFAGIGRPEKFFATLERCGATLVEARGFPDHHPYRDAELRPLARAAEAAGAKLATTAKDAVRLPPALRAAVRVLEVRVAWEDEAALASLLRSLMVSRAA
jgi:tetraacyldisaccharide 4'-kinase